MEPVKFLVGGEWRTSSTTRQVVNPFTRSAVADVYQAGASDIEDAIQSASHAFRSTRKLPSHKRSAVLRTISEEIADNKDRFARLITAETGKPITFSRAEVERSIFTFSVAAEEASRIEGTVLPLDLASNSENRLGIVRRFPLGPISAITPFNFPINLVAHKVGPAIASGNPIVLKPSSNAPQTALLLGELILESGWPVQALSVLTCSGDNSRQLITDERIKLVTFTGSPHVGWGIKAIAGKKRVTLELGGNAAVVIDEGVNLDKTIDRIVQGAYGNAGQSCIAVQRIIVHRSLFDRFVDRFVEASSLVLTGDPMDEKTVIGPMIDEESARKIETWLGEAVKAGAKVLCGGRRSGAMLEATVVVDVKNGMKISCQEVFAPLVTIEPFNSFSQALDMVNNSDYGLQAGVFTNDLKNAFHAYDELEVGGVIINDYPTYRIDHMPYGGVKDSGFGREGIRYAIDEMTELKLMALNLS
jgi:acyl-CoA reductase-like NAD-dependent aldehyde dehydrogenase